MIKSARQRGVSLLEALVAMAVMAVGAVAVVGLQATLRMNGDLAKQRAEATRLAQEVVEGWRGYQALAATPDVVDWMDIQSVTTTGIVGVNATFTRQVTVVPRGAADDDPLSKTVHVRVTWQDRTGQDQSIGLNTLLAGVHPELAGSLSIPMDGSVGRLPGGRHPAVPRTAIDQGDGTSRFSPPGGGTQLWVFNNATGVIVKFCTAADSCSDIIAYLLHGFVRFSTAMVQPLPAQAEAPASTAFPVTVTVNQESPFTTSVTCFGLFDPAFVEYFCLMQVTSVTPRWTGVTELVGLDIASSMSEDDDDKFKVCRYTPVRSCHPAVGSVIWGAPGSTASCSGSAPTPSRKMSNEEHPQRYLTVDRSLTNQNFLVIRSGDDSNPFACPDDNPSTPNVNSATWNHQPPS